MVRYMADSVDGKAIPPSVIVPGAGSAPVSLRVGYANGSYHNSSFDNGTPDVVVDVAGTVPSADVLDIETGDATPDTAPGWVKAHNALGGFRAVLYCNRATITAVANACAAQGLLPGRDFSWWIATLDGTKSVPDMTGVVAVQVWGANFFSENVDLSIVYDDSWKPAAAAPVAEVHGEIGGKYALTPGLKDILGPPITPEMGCPDGVGRFNHFQNAGSIYWTPSTGAFSIHGNIRALWSSMGWERSKLGYPISDELAGFDRYGNSVRASFFQHGCILWDAKNGARAYIY